MYMLFHNCIAAWRNIFLFAVISLLLPSAPTRAETTLTEDEKVVVLLILNQFIQKGKETEQVCIYEATGLVGPKTCFTESQAHLDIRWDNVASSLSISLPSHYVLTMYTEANFAGDSSVFEVDHNELGVIDNLISSVKIELRDTDNDGVADINDECPDTPAGEPADASGCSASQRDTDQDGVNDAQDQCPQTQLGLSVNSDGCALNQLDSDDDGVTDDIDQCPDTPSNPPAGVTVLGCAIDPDDFDGDGIPNADDSYPHQHDFMCTP